MSEGAQCFDCGFEYGSPGWVDAVIPDDDWIAIGMKRCEGLLCFNCIMKRCEGRGVKASVVLMSGPILFDNGHKYWEERYSQIVERAETAEAELVELKGLDNGTPKERLDNLRNVGYPGELEPWLPIIPEKREAYSEQQLAIINSISVWLRDNRFNVQDNDLTLREWHQAWTHYFPVASILISNILLARKERDEALAQSKTDKNFISVLEDEAKDWQGRFTKERETRQRHSKT